jgi:hypothetical protein
MKNITEEGAKQLKIISTPIISLMVWCIIFLVACLTWIKNGDAAFAYIAGSIVSLGIAYALN